MSVNSYGAPESARDFPSGKLRSGQVKSPNLFATRDIFALRAPFRTLRLGSLHLGISINWSLFVPHTLLARQTSWKQRACDSMDRPNSPCLVIFWKGKKEISESSPGRPPSNT